MSKAKLIKKSEQHRTEEHTNHESARSSLQTAAKSVTQWVRETRAADVRSPRQKFAALFAQSQS